MRKLASIASGKNASARRLVGGAPRPRLAPMIADTNGLILEPAEAKQMLLFQALRCVAGHLTRHLPFVTLATVWRSAVCAGAVWPPIVDRSSCCVL